MKFKIGNEDDPILGDTRTIRRFAWLPVYCKDHIVWFEDYESVQKYSFVETLQRTPDWVEIDRKEIM
jgi:hypothetical protein